MKNRRFFQLHPVMILQNVFFLFAISDIVCIIIIDPFMDSILRIPDNPKKIIIIILYYLAFLYFCWMAITANHNWISFNRNYLYVPSDWRMKKNRKQFQVKVNYEDIENVSFIRRTKNSKNKEIQEESIRQFYHHYLVLFLKNGKKEHILLDYYTKKQKAKITDELLTRLNTYDKNLDRAEIFNALNNLGMFGVCYIIDIAEKDEKKRIKK